MYPIRSYYVKKLPAFIQARKVEIEHQPFDPDRLITEVVDMFSNAAARKGIHLSHTVKGLPEGLKGDPARLRQILANP